MKELNWVILGCGNIANTMAETLNHKGRKIYGVANRSYDKACAFAEKYNIGKVFHTIDEVFEDKNADIVYVAVPHNHHIEYIKKALLAGKHVLAEKAITLNLAQLDEAIAIAKEKNLILAEAMTVYHMPLYKELWKKLEDGEFGKVQMITMNFGSFKDYDMTNRFFNMQLAGGAMLDIGVYALSIVRGFMSCKPDQIQSQWKPSPTGSDEQAGILLKNADDQMAAVALTMHSRQPKRAMISCEKAYIEIMEYPRASKAVIVDAETCRSTTIESGSTADALYYEVLDMEEAVKTGNAGSMHLDYSHDVMSIMTEVRYSWGMKYPEEQ